MKKSINIGVFLFISMMSLLFYSCIVVGQTRGQDLLNRPINLHLRKETLMLVLSDLSVDNRIAIGIEYSLADKNEPKISIDVDNGTLKEVLDSIVEQEPLYRWELVDDVINFVPTRDRDPFFEVLLNARVDHFDPGKWTIIFQVRDAIGDIPQVELLLKSNRKRLTKYTDYAYYPSIYTKKGVDLSISNTTVRGVLNRIVRDTEHKKWSISWLPGDKDAVAIRF